MRQALLLATALAAASIPASAQHGNVGIFVDPAGDSCRLSDVGRFNVYVVHVDAEQGAAGSSFRVVPSAGVTATWIFESSTFATAGVSQTGLSVSYGGCESGSFVILSMIYMGAGSTPACERLDVLANPSEPDPTKVRVDDCGLGPHLIDAGHAGFFGGDDNACACEVPVAQHTWGAIKSLYL